MSLTYEQIAAKAMQLSPKERAEVARRVAQLDRGEVETIPHEEVMAELRAKLR